MKTISEQYRKLKLLIVSVTTKAAEKTLAGGRNAPLIVQPKAWPLQPFGQRFSWAQNFNVPDEFIGLFEP